MAAAPQRRLDRWWDARLQPTDTVLLTQRNVYILPTRAGLMFALTLFTLLLASINYQLNLGYLLTFLLAGSGLASMHLTHGNLRGLQLHLKPVAPVHAGDAALLEVVLAAPPAARAPRHGLGLRCQAAGEDTLAWVDVPAGGQASSHVAWQAATRGLQPLPRLVLATRFPLGLFRAWTVWRPAGRCLVYPRLEPLPPPLPQTAGGGSDGQPLGRAEGGSETEGVRAYRRGDPPKWVLWKKAAKQLEGGGELSSRDTRTPVRRQLWLDWQEAAGLAPEDRLSRLAAWVVAADRQELLYGLRLPGRELAPDRGDAHRRACLEALALWQ
ncbi:DUF58 domain-containing protein [Piscinibacter sakaiensis]|uniref:DUF58 domain-containing protein n=1 Tax=Piscinibacter sakaiensis TaxID=1547922 RepID=UPI0009E9FBE7